MLDPTTRPARSPEELLQSLPRWGNSAATVARGRQIAGVDDPADIEVSIVSSAGHDWCVTLGAARVLRARENLTDAEWSEVVELLRSRQRRLWGHHSTVPLDF